jgi:hypothetical protein
MDSRLRGNDGQASPAALDARRSTLDARRSTLDPRLATRDS